MNENEKSKREFDFNTFRSELTQQRKRYAGMPITGERLAVPRADGSSVDTIIYRPEREARELLPVLFNLHGGAWIGGDAVLMDSFCRLLADEIPALIVNVNYTKIDIRPFPNPQDELFDTVLWFAGHAAEYGIDSAHFAIGGHSAGAHITAGTAIRLKEHGFKLACQMLVYPFTDFTQDSSGEAQGLLKLLKTVLCPEIDLGHPWYSPLQADPAELTDLAPAIFIIAGQDDLKPMGIAYAKRLIDYAVPVKVKEYPEALHGFLEVNRPEYEGDARRSPEQLAMTEDCEQYLIRELRASLFQSPNSRHFSGNE